MQPRKQTQDVTTSGADDTHVVSPEEEYLFWENNYATRDYIDLSLEYGIDYAPAYRYGIQTFVGYGAKPFDTLDEEEMRRGWEHVRGRSSLSWNEAKNAVRDAYDRLFSEKNSLFNRP